MSKKGRPKASELIAVRVEREEAWAYARHLEHLSYRAMRAAALADPPHGLGYDLSEQMLKTRVTGYLERMRETLTDDRDAYIAREIADLDEQQRALMALLVRGVDLKATTILAGTLGYRSAGELVAREPELAVPLDVPTTTLLLRELRAVGAERRKLLGLDAPIAARLDVTHHDAVAQELAAMLDEVERARPQTPEKVSDPDE